MDLCRLLYTTLGSVNRFVYVSVCRVHKTWTTWKDTQIDLKVFDLLSEF